MPGCIPDACLLMLLLLLVLDLDVAAATVVRTHRALWGPGSDPVRSVPTQVGTNYMEWPGLREVDQEEGAAGEMGLGWY